MIRRALLLVLLALEATGCLPPSWGAGALLHPGRRIVRSQPDRPFEELDVQGEGVTLRAWRFPAHGPRRGTVVYLHGVADNRAASAGIAARFAPRGLQVISYDSRAHGDSTGDACTYGFYEKRDLHRVLDTIDGGPVVLIGSSLGAAVALQAAAADHRVSAVISVATFSDLRTIASERAPFFASASNVEEALRIAERRASFQVDDVSPVRAASRLRIPVLVIHGAEDRETSPDHSRRVYRALKGPKRLIVVPKAGHNDCLTRETWRQIQAWLDGLPLFEAP